MLKAEEFKTIEEARTTIHESFGIKVYKINKNNWRFYYVS